ncbi:MAG: aminotransferase class IV [Nitrospinales bacterium]
MTTKINFNGNILDEASISVLDHGFLFGDSVYEVINTRKNIPCFVDKHLKRLRQSAEGISLKLPYDDEQFQKEIYRTLEAADNEESYIRVIVTRGVGEISIDPSSCKNPNMLILVTSRMEIPNEYYSNGINVALVSIKRNPKDALNPKIKTGNYLNNVLAKVEANKVGAQDALMLNTEGFLTECTTSNFFLVRDGRIMTPSLDCGILSGITRELAIQLAREQGMIVEEGRWLADELEHADEAFLTGTLKEVLPVTRLNGKPIGEGKPGPVTQKIMRLYADLLDSLG